MTAITSPATELDEATEALRRPPRKPTSWLLTVFMLICLGYFLLPLFWLVVASTKSNADLFSSFGLWFADFNLIENIQTVLTVQDGVFIRWAVNTVIYAVVSAVGAAFLATAAGYAFAKYQFPGGTALFAIILGAIMIPSRGPDRPDLPAVRPGRAHRHLLGDHLAVPGQPVRGVPDARLRRRRGRRHTDRSRPGRRRRGAADLLHHRVPAAAARFGDRFAFLTRGDVEQLLPAADHAQLGRQVPVNGWPGPVAVDRERRLGLARPSSRPSSPARCSRSSRW